jgi:hypothetical protein
MPDDLKTAKFSWTC